MITFTDLTINEAGGNFDKVSELMMEDIGSTKWMLRSDVTVVTEYIVSNFKLHFWGDGKVYIKETTRPTSNNAPDDDLKELRDWCTEHGWKIPTVDSRLTVDARGFDFWLNKFRSALVDSDELRKFEEDETKRMMDSIEEEQDEFLI